MGKLRRAAAPKLSAAVTQAMQQLGMAGGRFEVALLPPDAPQSFGLESVEFRVAGHAGSSPRPLAKVASGGELSRLALAIAVTTAAQRRGGADADLRRDRRRRRRQRGRQVGRLMKQLGGSSQVLAVTHLAQVAACADHHFVVTQGAAGHSHASATCSRWPARRVWPRWRACSAANGCPAPAAPMPRPCSAAASRREPKPARSAQKQR